MDSAAVVATLKIAVSARDRKHAMRMLVAVPLAAMLLAPPEVVAFTFSDGTSAQCIAAGRAVSEVDADPGSAGFTGKAVEDAGELRIVWNQAKLAALPPVMHDYIFFHECAHLRVPTRDEIKANCVGLKDMRAAGRAGAAVEAEIAAFYGALNDYWARTVQCADAGVPASGAAPRR
jgi:hypothetical protein